LRRHAFLLLAIVLVACTPARTPEDVHAELLRKLPAGLPDRVGWARDIQAALVTQDIPTTSENLCAVMAVVEQESTYRADPPVPGLPRIARAELDRRAAKLHIPAFVVGAALDMRAPDGRTYAQRIAALRSEQELSALFEEMADRVPMGRRLLAGFNPVRTGGPMQVSIAFAQAHARSYPYPRDGSIRHEVFTRRGGLFFGTRHLLGYPARYRQPLFRFADFNAGWYASRNAAFQRAVSLAAGRPLAFDGDLLGADTPMETPGPTEAAIRSLRPRLALDDGDIRDALARGHRESLEDTALYRDVFALAEARIGGSLARARVPEIRLHSPKITRKLTTAWFADRVNQRWKRCMGRR
jgi:hypothetical protein